MILPGTPEWRRRAAVLFLALGGVVAGRTISHDLPHEQTLVFRLDEGERHVPLVLSANLTRVGDSEPRAGFEVTRDGTEAGDVRETLHLPDGEYVLAVDYTLRNASAAGRVDGAAPTGATKEGETTRMERVTLTGGETVVLLKKRVAE